MSKTIIDILSEDPEITGQKYALISIVGPNMSQKCDVWGLKIRGVAESLEKAKAMTKRLMKIENTYDIYTVDVGKFFPLAVEPYDIKDIEYENVELNKLVKTYLENKEQANDHYHQRKQDMMEKAIQEGKKESQESGKLEHPISILQRKQTSEMKLKQLREEVETLEKDLELTSEKYLNYPEKERQLAEDQLKKATETETKIEDKKTVEDIRNEITNELKNEMESNPLNTVLEELNKVENEIKKLNNTSNDLNTLESKREQLKLKLNDKKSVNDYINKSFVSESQHDSLF